MPNARPQEVNERVLVAGDRRFVERRSNTTGRWYIVRELPREEEERVEPPRPPRRPTFGQRRERMSSKADKLSPGTFGIEFELNNVRNLCKKVPSGWNYTNDISVQARSQTFKGKPLKGSSTLAVPIGNNADRVGIELVSPILEDFSDVMTVLDIIKETGVKTKSKDCGIHIHVSYPTGPAVISLFKVALKYEPIFYAIGTFGGFSRGKYKDYIYQRPLARAPIVRIAETNRDMEHGNTYYGHVFDVSKFPEVNDEEDFRQFLSGNKGGKYNASKYCGINFYSYYYRNTVELRTFNLTTNYSYLKAAVNFARDFVFAGIKEYYSQEEGEEVLVNFINGMSKDEILELLDEFLEKYSNFTDQEDIYTLRRLINESPKIEIPEFVFFHLMFHRNGDNAGVYTYRRKRFLPDAITGDIKRPVTEELTQYEFD